MTWTAGTDRTTGALISASDWNALLGATGSLMETGPAKATTAGDMLYATGPHALGRLGIGSTNAVLQVVSGVPAWVSNPVLSGELDFSPDNTYTIGKDNGGTSSPTVRPKKVYVAGRVVIGDVHSNLEAGGIILADTIGVAAQNQVPNGNFGLIRGNSGVVEVAYDGVNTALCGFTYPKTDNSTSFGDGTHRWTALYAVNGAIQTSSAAAKNLLGRVDPAEALRVVLATGMHRFTYKTGADQDDLHDFQHVGFLAEDTDPLLCPDGASASPQTTACVALAAIQELHRRLSALEARP